MVALFHSVVALLGLAVLSTATVTHEQALSLKHTDTGIYIIGSDGVMRSFDDKGTVLDYLQLSNEELINQVAVRETDATEKEHLTTLWAGIDGHNVSKEKCENPDTDDKPSESQLAAMAVSKPQAIETGLEERQLGFCDSQQCTTSWGCFLVNCGPCVQSGIQYPPRSFCWV